MDVDLPVWLGVNKDATKMWKMIVWVLTNLILFITQEIVCISCVHFKLWMDCSEFM